MRMGLIAFFWYSTGFFTLDSEIILISTISLFITFVMSYNSDIKENTIKGIKDIISILYENLNVILIYLLFFKILCYFYSYFICLYIGISILNLI